MNKQILVILVAILSVLAIFAKDKIKNPHSIKKIDDILTDIKKLY